MGVVKLTVPFVHTGLLLETAGADKELFTETTTVPAKLVQPPTVSVRLYVPDIAEVALFSEGFCEVLVKEFGPVQA